MFDVISVAFSGDLISSRWKQGELPADSWYVWHPVVKCLDSCENVFMYCFSFLVPLS